MRVFVAGSTGAVGKHLVPLLLESAHEVVALVRTSRKGKEVEALGAKAVVADALDKDALTAAIRRAEPEVIIHQLTALVGVADFRRLDEEFALTNRLRTEATETMLAAGRLVRGRRFIAQSFCGWPFAREGGPIKTEEDPLDPTPPASFRKTLAAIHYLEEAVRRATDLQALALRYGFFYGPGTSIANDGAVVGLVCKRRIPFVGDGAGIWSFIHIQDAARATVAAISRGAPGIYNIVDDEPAPASTWLPLLADVLGAKPPRKVPVWLAGSRSTRAGGVASLKGLANHMRYPVIDWLLDTDPSIRWQVMRDLTDTPAEIVAAERSRVASEGWGPRLLDQQRPDGHWGDGVTTPLWWSNLYTLLFLRDLGLDPMSARARTAIDLVRSNVTWGPGFGDSPFFEGEVEPCINGRVVALGAYFGERSDRLVDRLLSEQLVDGGWNCEAERGSVRSSFHTTICVLEGLLAFEQAFGARSAVTDARRRAQEYLLERRLLRRLSTGEIIEPTWTRFAFPTLWHYDVLRALDYLRAAGVRRDERAEEAVATVLERDQGAGRWLLDVRHRNTLHEELAGTVGAPNRWITLRALRVLEWYARRD